MRKVIFVFYLIAFLSFIGGPAKAQELYWAKRAGSTGFDVGTGIAVDERGNSYVTGSFQSNIIVAKYDRKGALIWAKQAGGAGGSDITIDRCGNSYVTGSLQGTVTFGPGEANETELTGVGAVDIFVAKYDRKGALVWVKQAGDATANDYVVGTGIAVDEGGNSYVTGSFQGMVTFGAGEANETELKGGYGDIFVAKYNRKGGLVWAKRVYCGFSADSTGIALDKWGNSYVTGSFDRAIFGPGEANETDLTSVGGIDMFIAKYDRKGALIWAIQAGGVTANDYGFGSDITIDKWENSYVTGSLQGTVTFGPGEANETELTSVGDGDMFIAKYDRKGALIWAIQAGGIDDDYGFGTGIALDKWGNSYVLGRFDGAVTFGPGEANETDLASVGDTDIFVAKYDSKGNLVCAIQAGGISNDYGNDIATDGWGNSYVTGFFQGTVTFGAGEANETELTSAGYYDMFIAKYKFSRKKRAAME